MTERIHLVVREEEKEKYRRSAERSGLTLSEWLREAAREKLALESRGRSIETIEDLDAFFAECDARHEGEGPEADWQDHRKVVEASVRSGFAGAEDA